MGLSVGPVSTRARNPQTRAKSSQGRAKTMIVSESSATMPATILAATSLTGWGKEKTPTKPLERERAIIANVNLFTYTKWG